MATEKGAKIFQDQIRKFRVLIDPALKALEKFKVVAGEQLCIVVRALQCIVKQAGLQVLEGPSEAKKASSQLYLNLCSTIKTVKIKW